MKRPEVNSVAVPFDLITAVDSEYIMVAFEEADTEDAFLDIF